MPKSRFRRCARGNLAGTFAAGNRVKHTVHQTRPVIVIKAARHIDISLASSITTPWPALTMVLAVIFLGDRVEPYQIGAFIVVGLCIYGLTFLGTRNKAP